MKDVAKLVLVLAVICAAAAAALAQVYALTKEPIAHQKRMELLGAIQEVLPAYDNEPDNEAVTVGGQVFYPGRKDGALVGAAIPVSSTQGYSGLIEALVGVDAEGAVQGVRVLTSAETPGLGSKIKEPAYLDKLVYQDEGKTTHRTLANTNWTVKKDGGDVDQITGATISPRALVGAVAEGLTAYDKSKGEIAGDAGEPAEPETPPAGGEE